MQVEQGAQYPKSSAAISSISPPPHDSRLYLRITWLLFLHSLRRFRNICPICIAWLPLLLAFYLHKLSVLLPRSSIAVCLSFPYMCPSDTVPVLVRSSSHAIVPVLIWLAFPLFSLPAFPIVGSTSSRSTLPALLDFLNRNLDISTTIVGDVSHSSIKLSNTLITMYRWSLALICNRSTSCSHLVP